MGFNGIYSGWWYTNPSEKYEFVNWDDDIPNIWKNKKCSTPPTRFLFAYLMTPLESHEDRLKNRTSRMKLMKWQDCYHLTKTKPINSQFCNLKRDNSSNILPIFQDCSYFIPSNIRMGKLRSWRISSPEV